MKYRPEIDGLRALAVLPVILFHAGVQFFSGGFVGVDVFFVISGYLITSIILREKEAGTFSLASFYERRMRRILPALFFIMLCCLPFAWMLMMPAQLKSFAKSLYTVVFFASNIQFMDEVDYFADLSEDKPLLHTWSLAVEEQYYILFPLFIMMFWRFGKQRLMQLTTLGLVASLLLSEYGWRHEPVFNFYLVITRAWEILFGALCGFYLLKREPKSDQAYSLIGLGMLVLSIILYDKSTPFPSLYTLLPVIGTCLIILFSGQKTIVGKLLSTKGLVTIGLMSYSLYLWHQPLFAFARIRSFGAPSSELLLGLSAVACGLSYLTWKYIEAPFRNRHTGMSKRRVFQLALCFALFFVAIGLIGDKTDGVKHRFTDKIQAVLKPPLGDTSQCHNMYKHDADKIRAGETCVIGDKEVTPTIAMIGDSHASRITDALSNQLVQTGQSMVSYNASWCIPFVGLYADKKSRRHCQEFINASYESVLNNDDIKTIILFAQWANIPKGHRWGEDEKTAYGFADQSPRHIKNNETVFNLALNHTMEMLKTSKKRVIIIGPIPEFETVIPYTLAKFHHFNKGGVVKHKFEDSLNVTREKYQARNKQVLIAFDHIRTDYDVDYINPFPIYCGQGFCQYESEDGTPFYEDGSHQTFVGAQPLAKAVMKELN